MYAQKSFVQNFCTKKALVKCWWNWHLVSHSHWRSHSGRNQCRRTDLFQCLQLSEFFLPMHVDIVPGLSKIRTSSDLRRNPCCLTFQWFSFRRVCCWGFCLDRSSLLSKDLGFLEWKKLKFQTDVIWDWKNVNLILPVSDLIWTKISLKLTITVSIWFKTGLVNKCGLSWKGNFLFLKIFVYNY